MHQVFAHRGYHALAIENTLAAFEHAVSLGVDGIETDIRVTADGAIVLYHDRVAPNGREVAVMTHAELSSAAGHDVPLASDALERWPQVEWNLEIKNPAGLEPTIHLVRNFRSTHRFLVTSFWHNLVRDFRAAIDVPCGVLVAHRPYEKAFGEVLKTLRGSGIGAFVWYYETMDPALIAEAHAHDIRCGVYGLVTPAEHAACVTAGIDTIITDYPAHVPGFQSRVR